MNAPAPPYRSPIPSLRLAAPAVAVGFGVLVAGCSAFGAAEDTAGPGSAGGPGGTGGAGGTG
ncbi:protease, partial [Streptomyces sp. 15-116A]|nr:protease [Streptomyces sp. 15-116A]